jgi:hypothetical protein
MKISFTFYVFVLFFSKTYAQTTCGAPSAFYDLKSNNINARFLCGGKMFTDIFGSHFIPNHNGNELKPATIFTSSLWIGGFDLAGNVKIAAEDYLSDRVDFFAGPLQVNGKTSQIDCENWNRIFHVKKSEIDSFLADLTFIQNNSNLAIARYPTIMGWPAIGNPHFLAMNGFNLPTSTQGLASFKDLDGNGIYEPLKGDFPVLITETLSEVIPTEMVWYVYNDEGAGAIHSVTNGRVLNIEVQITAWVFDCQENSILDNTVFTSHKIINRSLEQLNAVRVGFFTDIDLGCNEDDYVGCLPAYNTMFAYNQDSIDGFNGASCGDTPTFVDKTPVQFITFLSKTLDNFLTPFSFQNSTGVTNPGTDIAYYNYLNGHWKDGTPITFGGDGYQSGNVVTNFAYSSDPSLPDGWSMCNTLPPDKDRMVIGSTNIESFLSGQITEILTAWSVHENIPSTCSLGNMLAELDFIKSIYNSNFSNAQICTPVIKTTKFNLSENIKIAPNPATSEVLIDFNDLTVSEIQLIGIDGRFIKSIKISSEQKVVFNLSYTNKGIYFFKIVSKEGIIIKKLVIE